MAHYDVVADPFCLNNLAEIPEYENIKDELKSELMQVLKNTNDPRVARPDTEIFDSYKRYSRIRNFPKPDWAEK